MLLFELVSVSSVQDPAGSPLDSDGASVLEGSAVVSILAFPKSAPVVKVLASQGGSVPGGSFLGVLEAFAASSS